MGVSGHFFSPGGVEESSLSSRGGPAKNAGLEIL